MHRTQLFSRSAIIFWLITLVVLVLVLPEHSPIALAAPLVDTYTRVSAGMRHTCAIKV